MDKPADVASDDTPESTQVKKVCFYFVQKHLKFKKQNWLDLSSTLWEEDTI